MRLFLRGFCEVGGPWRSNQTVGVEQKATLIPTLQAWGHLWFVHGGCGLERCELGQFYNAVQSSDCTCRLTTGRARGQSRVWEDMYRRVGQHDLLRAAIVVPYLPFGKLPH
eukprot:788472-Pyramimonas_sp.AAC.1